MLDWLRRAEDSRPVGARSRRERSKRQKTTSSEELQCRSESRVSTNQVDIMLTRTMQLVIWHGSTRVAVRPERILALRFMTGSRTRMAKPTSKTPKEIKLLSVYASIRTVPSTYRPMQIKCGP